MEMIDFKTTDIRFYEGKSYEISLTNDDESTCLAFTLPSADGIYISFELVSADRKKLDKYVSSKSYRTESVAKQEILNILNQFVDSDEQISIRQLGSYLSANAYNLIPIVINE